MLEAKLGLDSVPVELQPPSECAPDEDCLFRFGSLASLNAVPSLDGRCRSIEWQSQFDSIKVVLISALFPSEKLHLPALTKPYLT